MPVNPDPASAPAQRAREALFFALALAFLLAACGSSTSTYTTPSVDVLTITEEYSNVHLVTVNQQRFLVDIGLEATAPAVEEALREAGIDPSTLRGVILTHGHADHAGASSYFQRQFSVPIIASRGDEALLDAGKNLGPLCPNGWVAEQRAGTDGGETYTPFKADLWVEDGLDLQALWGAPVSVAPMPGHTDGSLVVIAGQAAFVGDLFRGAIVGGGVETHFYMCDLDDNRRDIRALLDAWPQVTTFFPGHFGPVSREEVEAYLRDAQESADK